jgi:hypothetical protein
MRTDVIIVNHFYENPDQIRAYALSQPYYYPYQRRAAVASGKQPPAWQSTYFKPASQCVFKSSETLIARFEELTQERIDRTHWNKGFPVNLEQKLLAGYQKIARGCRWNCCFHLKYQKHEIGTGVHNHVTDAWNAVGRFGWTGLVYLNPDAPRDTGLRTWKNRFGKDFEWMTDKSRWQLIDEYANVYNRLILCRGWMPHSGGAGFSDSLRPETGRLFQTFFFKTLAVRRQPSLEAGVDIPL